MLSTLLETRDNQHGMIDMLAPVNRLAPLNRGLLAWYRVMPGIGGSLRFTNLVRPGDGSYNQGALGNGPVWSKLRPPGGYGSLEVVRASSQYVALGSLPIADLDNTMSCWVRFTSTTSPQRFLCFGDNAPTLYYAFTTSIGCVSGGSYDIVPEVTVTTSVWYHVLRTQKAGVGCQLYVNGVKSATDGARTAFTAGNGRIGGDVSYGEYADAQIDDCRFSNYWLTPNEARAAYIAACTGYKNEFNWLSRNLIVPPITAAPAGNSSNLLLLGVG